jgi:hypothetical protein
MKFNHIDAAAQAAMETGQHGRRFDDGSLRFDNGTIFTAQDLEFIETTVMETEFETLNGDLLVPTDTSVPGFMKTIAGKTSRTTGSPTWVGGGGASQINQVDLDVSKEIWSQYRMAIAASWTSDELEAARFHNMNLDTMEAQAAAQACLTLMDDVKFEGTHQPALRGYFGDSNVPKQEATIGLNDQFTPLQIVGALNDLVNSVADNTRSVEQPNRLSLSARAYRYCSDTPMSADNGRSILDTFLMNQTFITTREQVNRMEKLNDVVVAGSSPIDLNEVAVAHRFDPAKVRVNVTPPTPYGSIMQVGMSFVQIWSAVISEVQHRKPLASSYIFNTNRQS